jgi:predicted phage terminase large subunit-like protein
MSLIQEFREAVLVDNKVRTILLQRLDYHGPMPDQLDPKVTPPIVPIKVDKDKLARAEAVTPMVERGDMLLPDPEAFDAPWLGEYVRELLTFTGGGGDVHDDQVDATTQVLNYMRGLGSFDVMTFWRPKAEEKEARAKRLCATCRRPIDLQNEDYERSGEQFLHVRCPGDDVIAAR